MTKKEIDYMLADLYYRSGLIEDEKETIIYLPKEELETLKKEMKDEWFKSGLTITIPKGSIDDFDSYRMPYTGLVHLKEGKEFKVFQRVPMILLNKL